jgi:hypothetical protein
LYFQITEHGTLVAGDSQGNLIIVDLNKWEQVLNPAMFSSIGAVAVKNDIIVTGSGERFNDRDFSCGVRIWK